jgi:hypothetical protein
LPALAAGVAALRHARLGQKDRPPGSIQE